MKICAISDLHGFKIQIPNCDVLVFAGDISNSENAKWFKENFIPYLKENKHKYDICFVVFGNHDDKIQLSDSYFMDVPDYVKILTNTGYTYKGKKFFGSPFCKAAKEIIVTMNTFDDLFLAKLFLDIPSDTDILITHNPPFGFGDTTTKTSKNLGSISLMARVHIIKPQIHIFGHIHNGQKQSQSNGTTFYNVSVLNDDYKIVYKPTIINI